MATSKHNRETCPECSAIDQMLAAVHAERLAVRRERMARIIGRRVRIPRMTTRRLPNRLGWFLIQGG